MASAPLERFPLPSRLKANLAAKRATLTSPNIIARLSGTDPSLKAENVVLSAHLDGLGVGTPIKGDAIYNGALDNASGVATLIEIARKLRTDKARPKRSILFAIVTGEERACSAPAISRVDPPCRDPASSPTSISTWPCPSFR